MALIGISGKIGSGKDTVGQIIQYLDLPEWETADFNSFVAHYNENEWDTKWKVKKFADKLKDMVCLLIGCTRIQLEDRTFKESSLGPEWDRWCIVNYYLNNKIGESGDNGYYATKEEAIKEERNMRIGYRWGKDLESRFEITKMTPRLLLQLLGTDCGRDIIHPNVWVNSLMADYKITGHEVPPHAGTGIYDAYNSAMDRDPQFKNIYPNWLVTDTRFPNEADAILNKGGLLLRVNRGDGKTGNHPSEIALDNYKKFHYTIDNNGTMDELMVKVEKILKRENLL